MVMKDAKIMKAAPFISVASLNIMDSIESSRHIEQAHRFQGLATNVAL